MDVHPCRVAILTVAFVVLSMFAIGLNPGEVMLSAQPVEGSCLTGPAVSDSANNSDLVYDCEAVLTAASQQKASSAFAPSSLPGPVVSEGVAAHGANFWQIAGFTGKGVKIGIIDAGYDSYHSLAGSELPSNVEVLCFTDIGGRSSPDISDCSYPGNPEWVKRHGTGSMEVLFDFAPDAAYYVTNFHHGLDNLREAVDWMIANGVDVINASQGFNWSGPGDGTSPDSNSIFRIVDAAVSGGVVWVNAADNKHLSSWLGPFNDPDGNGYHNFLGDDECNGIDVQIGDFGFSSSLRWEDDWPGAVSDLDLYLRDASGNVVLRSEGSQRGGAFDLPHEVIKPDHSTEGTYCLAVRHRSGPQPGWIEFEVSQDFGLEHFTDGGGLNTAAESRNPGLLAVGAAHWRDTHTIMPYSSRGPTTDGRIKPDITGATGGWSVGFGGEYGGTSGASPHIAGLAALVKSRFPNYSPEEVATYLKDNADPRGDVPNNAWGYGFARLPAGDDIEIPTSPDRDALIASYHATGGPNWRDQENWLSDRHIGEWSGVEIDRWNRVVRLNLQGNQLSGTISPLLKDLHSLQNLDLGVNGLSGDVPQELGGLANLTRLNLGTNQLIGEIPVELSNLTYLQWLYLDNNELTGEIPPQLGNLSNMIVLDLYQNHLSGAVPPELGRLSNLRGLSLWGNELDGPIPSELGDLSNLTHLVLGRNELTGGIPPQLANLSSLEQLWLDNNLLIGRIPRELGNLSNLRALSLWGNQLDGTIPPELGDLTNLTHLYLSSNQLSGPIPEELGNLSNLTELFLGGNRLIGCIPEALRDVENNDFERVGLPFCESQSPGAPSVSTATAGVPVVRLRTAIPVTATFSEPINGLAVGDIIVANGSPGNFAGGDGDSVYTFDVTPNTVGVVTVDIASGVAHDSEGNGNTAADQLVLGIPYDDDHDGSISRDEVTIAIGDHLFGGRLTRDEVLQIIGLHLFGPSLDSNTSIEYPKAVFDRLIPGLLEKWEVPGASVAIARDGKLVLARGYGMADKEKEKPVDSDSLFRIASISKPITAVAVLQLVEDGGLNLDDKVFQILNQFQPPEGATRDPRLDDIRIRHLLQHSGGWDRDKSYDPMSIAGRIERELGVPKPVTCQDVIRFMLGQPLDFDPGTRYAYSNFGYCLLGRVIEAKTNQPYEEYVRESVLEPLGITRMGIGGTLLEDRVEGEVRYYDHPGQDQAYSVMPGTPEQVPWPYGGFHLRTMDSHGGWISSAVDLVRFTVSIDGSRPPPVLDPATVNEMVSRPAPPLWEDSAYYYGMGWLVRPVTDDANWWHDGSLPGTSSLLVRTHDGFAWAVLFNSRPSEWNLFIDEVDQLMWQGIGEVSHWPSHDLFKEHGHELADYVEPLGFTRDVP